MCCACGGGTTEIGDTFNLDLAWLGGFLIAIELTGWILFYISFKGSLRYGNYLIESGEKTDNRVFDQFSANNVFSF